MSLEQCHPASPASPAVALGQLDAIVFNPVDRADMLAVGADDFHVFLNLHG
jgi:hypothetical protein